MDIANRLSLLAGALDEVHLSHLSAIVDESLSGLAKTAQYVGVQGYWVRNSRCWQNCYRNKRASTPSKPAQEIWFECQGEYQESIQNDGSKWDKYAGSQGLVKTAAYKQQEQKFASEFKTRVAGGKNPAPVVFSIIDVQKEEARNILIESSSKMLRVAESLQDVNILLANEAGTLSSQLLKLALWPFGKKQQAPVNPQQNQQAADALNQMVGRPANPAQANLPPQQQQMNQQIGGLEQMTGMNQGSTSFRDLMNRVSSEIQKRHQGLSQLSKEFYQYLKGGVQKEIQDFVAQNPSPEVKALAQQANSIFSQMAGAKSLNSYQLREFQQKLSQLGTQATAPNAGGSQAPQAKPPALPSQPAQQVQSPAGQVTLDNSKYENEGPPAASMGQWSPEQQAEMAARNKQRRQQPVAASSKVKLFKLSQS